MNDREDFNSMSRKDVARMLDVSEGTMTKFIQDGMPFIEIDGTQSKRAFDSRKVIDWIVKRGGVCLNLLGPMKHADKIKKLNKQISQDDDEDDDSPELFSDQLERQRKLKGDLYEVELAKKKGELIEKIAHDEFVLQAGEFCRSAFQAIPKKIAVEVAKQHDSNIVEKIIEREIVNVLRELSNKKI